MSFQSFLKGPSGIISYMFESCTIGKGYVMTLFLAIGYIFLILILKF